VPGLWITPTQAARIAGRTPQTIHAWIRSGKLHTICDTTTRQTLIDWASVYDATLTTPRRRRTPCQTNTQPS
jgi:hypothetical protein